MHHFTIYTSVTISERKEVQDVWQIEIPKMAYSYGFLMHGILSLAALHLSHLKPENYGDYMTSSRMHLTFGLRSFVRVLPSPTTENCSALFSFCSVIMIYTYGCPMESNEVDTAVLLNNIIEVFRVSRGTLIIMPYLKSMGRNGLEPLFRQEYNPRLSSSKK
jgi:Fungal specific transcription factor domain